MSRFDLYSCIYSYHHNPSHVIVIFFSLCLSNRAGSRNGVTWHCASRERVRETMINSCFLGPCAWSAHDVWILYESVTRFVGPSVCAKSEPFIYLGSQCIHRLNSGRTRKELNKHLKVINMSLLDKDINIHKRLVAMVAECTDDVIHMGWTGFLICMR